jgi:hypothetical protein
MSNIQPGVEGVVFDELAAGLDDVAHENGEHLVGIERVLLVQVDFEEAALLGVHRGFEELLGIHFSETFEALNGEAAFADLDDALEDFGDREDGLRDGFVAFAFDEFEERGVVVREVFDFEAFLRQLVDEFLDGDGLVEFDQTGAAADGGFVFFRLGGGFVDRRSLAFGGSFRGLDFEEVEVGVFSREFADLFLAGEIGDPLFVAFADFRASRGVARV